MRGSETQFLAVSREQQWAEKFHAYTRPREKRVNTLSKDLVDLVLLGELSLARLMRCVTTTFERRATHTIPAFVFPPPPEWELVFARLARDAGIDPDLTQAFQTLAEFWTSIGSSQLESRRP